MLRSPLLAPSASALLSLILAACATAGVEDRGRGTDEDGGPKPNPPDGGSGRPDVGDVADAAPVPDAGPPSDGGECEAELVDLLANGPFDDGVGVGWAETSGGGFPLVVAEGDGSLPDEFTVVPDTPAFLLYLGGYNSAVDQAEQDVVVPGDAAALRLTGKARIETLETAALDFDRAFLEIASTAGVLEEELALFTNQDDTGEQFITFDIPVAKNFAGQTVRFQVRDAADGSLDTHFFFDTLRLEASTCPGPVADRR